MIEELKHREILTYSDIQVAMAAASGKILESGSTYIYIINIIKLINESYIYVIVVLTMKIVSLNVLVTRVVASSIVVLLTN